MLALKDQMGRVVRCIAPPQRVVSLVPSQTELLFDMGLEKRVVGITKFCVHPEHWRKEKTVVGGTKQIRIQTLLALKPDLIIANKEENTHEMVAELKEHAPVYVSDVHDLPSALQMIQDLGYLTSKKQKAQQIIASIQQQFERWKPLSQKKTALYLIWEKPYMVAGNDTFIHDIMGRIGLKNVICTARYPVLSVEEMIDLNPEVLLLSSEPFPFKDKHINKIKTFLPQAKVLLVDGEMFSWYGSRLMKVDGELERVHQILFK